MTTSPLRALYDRIGPTEYQRQMRYACWRAGDLSYALNPSQRQLRALWRDPKHRRVVGEIARRWGKSRTCSVIAAEDALSGPDRRFLYAAQTQTAVREFVTPHFAALAADAPDDLRPEIVGNEVRFRNGSRIVLQGCEDQLKADRLRGPAAHGAVIDEGGFIPILRYVVTSVVRPQLSTTGGKMLLASSPPESPDHEFTAFAIEAEERGAYMRRDIYDAPHIPPEEIAQWCADVGGEDSIAWQREGLAMRVTDPTRAVLPEFSEYEKSIVRDDIARPQHFHTLIVGDLGYVDMTVVGIGYIDFEAGGRLVIEDEVALRRPTSDVVHRHVSSRYSERYGNQKPLVRKLDGNPITVADIARLEQVGLEGDAQRERWQAVYNGDLNAAVNALRLRIKRGGLVIHPRCKVLIAHARSARWNQARTSFERMQSEDGQHHYDGCAALVYLAREARTNEHRNPVPRLPPNVNHHTHRIPAGLLGDPRIEKFKRAFAGRRERR